MSTQIITHNTNSQNNPSAGIQSRINCQHIATALLGTGIPAGSCINHYAPEIDPDNPTIHVFSSHFRNPVTGYSGSSIKLIQRLKSYSYQSAIAYLEGFEAGKAQK